jgi:ribosome biogenesis GTPase A
MKEAHPDLPIYHSEFSKAGSACVKIPLDFLAAAEADQDPQLAAELWKKVRTVPENYQSKPESVAVVGKTGQGKSRLIDALLGIDQIARSVSTTSSKHYII